jgi:hypothetical protein
VLNDRRAGDSHSADDEAEPEEGERASHGHILPIGNTLAGAGV